MFATNESFVLGLAYFVRMEIRGKKQQHQQHTKKLTMWNIEFPVAKINEFPHHKVRTMHEIKMGIEFDAGTKKNVDACVRVVIRHWSHYYMYSIEAEAEAAISYTLFICTVYFIKNHTLSIYSHVFLLQHSNLFNVESGI